MSEEYIKKLEEANKKLEENIVLVQQDNYSVYHKLAHQQGYINALEDTVLHTVGTAIIYLKSLPGNEHRIYNDDSLNSDLRQYLSLILKDAESPWWHQKLPTHIKDNIVTIRNFLKELESING